MKSFKVWDKKFKRFIEGGELIFKLYGESEFEVNINELGMDSGENRQEDFIIIQNTGLKDKDDKEIWEGDIVEIHRKWGDGSYVTEPYKTIIVWCKKWAGFGLKDIRDNIVEEFGSVEYRKIGNIYENPELLKGV